MQIQRTMHSGRYTDGRAVPGGAAFHIEAGERSNFDQYRQAITAARQSIYLEHQSIEVPGVLDELRRALARGVEIVAVMPAEHHISSDLSALARYDNWTLAGIAGLGVDNRRKPVWVHAKLMIVDNAWATVGSCNLHYASLFGNAELNAAFWHPSTARTLRSGLLQEHLDCDTSQMDDRSALRMFRKIAAENRIQFESGERHWRGLAFTLLGNSNNKGRG